MSDRCERCGEVPNPNGTCACGPDLRDDEVITNADVVRACVDKLASECRLNPTAYQREAKEHLSILERENNQLRADLKQLAEALKKNHVWHAEYDEYQGYDESDLCEQNTKALSLPSVQTALKDNKTKE